MALKGDAKLEGKLSHSLKNDKSSLVNVNVSSPMPEYLHFDELLFYKQHGGVFLLRHIDNSFIVYCFFQFEP